VAFKRNDAALALLPATLNELLALTPASDYDWVTRLIETYNRERFRNDEAALIRLCFSAPQRVPGHAMRAFVMLDTIASDIVTAVGSTLAEEIIRILGRSHQPYLLAGLRRQLTPHRHDQTNLTKRLRLERLSEADGLKLVQHIGTRQGVPISDEVRDLLVQQFESSPLFITSFIQSAHERRTSLTSYLACQRLYVDEIMGGRLGRYFSGLLEDMCPDAAARQQLIQLLYESATQDTVRFPVSSWQKLLDLESNSFERVLHGLHVNEIITRDGNNIKPGGGPLVWKDFLTARYRLDVATEPRALVVAEMVTNSLKRAPQTMARHYRSKAAIGLQRIVAAFDAQQVPVVLFDYGRYREKHKGAELGEIVAALEAETELVQLPQVVYTASCVSFAPSAARICDEERCVVGHGFANGKYTEGNEVAWLVVEIHSKLEADLELTKSWYEWLSSLARELPIPSVQIWLVCPEGFSEDSCEFLAANHAYASSREQVELLINRLGAVTPPQEVIAENEFEMVVPMGGDNELLVAHTVEEIARRLHFKPDAVNQIKHAVVEAFINASEHSLSPDQRIYQRFRAESDKLVITVSSRGIVPVTFEPQKSEQAVPGPKEETKATKRGMGLSLIRTLMDEVEFERVDDGTSLRMTKYLRS
jgi:anti-sigma regulatory factor (Ser/Thr protein kinase)